jgi:hypothetical protein
MVGRNYRDLIAWQKAMSLVEEAYAFSRELPKEEVYGLTAQVRRSAVSIPTNIADSLGRNLSERPTANCQLPTANCQLPTAYCLLPTAYCLL